MTKDVSIEYAHIYTNQHISDEHADSVKILSEINADNQNNSLVVMVDDYSFPDSSFNYDEFADWLDEQGFKPEVMIRESQLIPVCDEVLAMINSETLKAQITDYIKSKKYPCSLFIAAWYLLRLGKITSPIFPEASQATRLLNILPESFKPFEDKGLEIIASTLHGDCVELIDYKFLPGRLIA